MDLGLAGRRAAVAASSSGLGLATAAALAGEGVQVVMCGRDRARLDAAVSRVDGARGVVADVSTPQGAEGFVHTAVDLLGGVDILVTNAGGPPAGSFESIDDIAAYSRAFELNCLSAVAMCRVGVPEMRRRGWGRVVAITSVTVRQPAHALILSTVARAGLTGFLKTLARDVAADGVTVNSLQPGLHRTARLLELHGDPASLAAGIPAGAIGEPSDFGAVVAFLCSDRARYVTGTALPVDGGTYSGLM